jgi:predicted CXXCH cytochrome family protein
VFDEVKDPNERRALLTIYKQQNPDARIRLAESFLRSYPRSSFLAEVYQVLAKAQIETGDYTGSLENAAKSLRLYPEDVLLTVSVADVQARQGLYPQAELSAQTSLVLLSHFVNPASVSSREWAKLKPQLQASCYFSLGRARMMQALGTGTAAGRTQGLHQALDHLADAARLNPEDDEVSYLQGLAELALGDLHSAEIYFARAIHIEGPLASKAREQLRKLYAHSPEFNREPFDAYVKSIPEPPVPAENRDVAQSASRLENLPPYAGSKACQQCHPDVYESWSHTGMSKMFRPYAAANVIGDFSGNASFDAGEVDEWKDGRLLITPAPAGRATVRMTTEHGCDYFDIEDSGGTWRRYRVDYTIGSKWEQAYATRLPNGEIHVFPLQYNRLQKRWVDFWRVIDPPGSPRADVTQWLKLDSSTSYQTNCAVCHTSQLRNAKGDGFAALGPEFREPGINCEMCHGPSLKHVEAMQKAHPYDKRPIDPPVDFAQIEPRQFVAICEQCHMQSAVRNPGPGGELNYSRTGEFFMQHQRTPYNVFSRKGFYKDGRFRETTFFVESMLRTLCFGNGKATCGSCHDPHPSNAASNPNSLKFLDRPDEICLQCHAPYREQSALMAHTHHAYSSPGSRCVSCHMPRIVDALLFEARSHEFDQIPDAQMTLTFGQQESPNACQLCHQQKTADWVKQALAGWNSPTKTELTGNNSSPQPSTRRAVF